MKRLLCFLGAVVFSATTYAQVGTNIVNIPDANFKNALIAKGVDTNSDNEISYGEAAVVTHLDVSDKQILNLTGIEAFTNLTFLNCGKNKLFSLDISNNTALTTLVCFANFISDLDVTNQLALTELICKDNKLTSLNVSNNTALTKLYSEKNKLTSLDVSNNTHLTELFVDDNLLTALDVSQNTALTSLRCRKNQLTSLNLGQNSALKYLFCSENQLTSLDVSNSPALESLICGDNLLTTIDVSNNPQLTVLSVEKNQLTDVNIGNNTLLQDLKCSHNNIQGLDITPNNQLKRLEITHNQLTLLNLANGNNIILKQMLAKNNPSLTCIQKDAGFTPLLPYPTPRGTWQKDPTASYSDNCNYPTASTQEVTSTHYLTAVSPMGDTLILKGDAKVEKVEIYSTAGQLVKVLLDHDRDVSALSKGVYFLKITTDKGVETIKVIK
ncbi:T9SS type A sorting domain-containing protein [Bergeyella zoohelcum]|uniref:Internalin-J n=1 Tax=Bergeyella zoohelcum TaxID=1015 RepID=A0A380ZUN2_9FLAO|nr:T9SS type A sorting domain-containing protein [Bergeyella zoohelcum]EKB61675.1 hypothetical protein HMPREF9700_00037 [Bergeyella zoohelcum CCUG 30536]SUV52379.1 Internalin-J precursor [Bergeyella zoohelcum]